MLRARRFFLFALIALFSGALGLPALALDLAQARNTGQVAEKKDGYLAVVQNTVEANALAKEVNDKRREEYVKIASDSGQPVQLVEKVAAEKIIRNLSAGNLYEGANGKWVKR